MLFRMVEFTQKGREKQLFSESGRDSEHCVRPASTEGFRARIDRRSRSDNIINQNKCFAFYFWQKLPVNPKRITDILPAFFNAQPCLSLSIFLPKKQ